ncbi:hypothetical protein RND81_10G072300 [Saponaria officinalis]|uniref:Homeobox-leucine zipper protein n=1 Tax=Saponaria officinalis TaxID=3572 RepID=A0AAW1HZ62_SAPOF
MREMPFLSQDYMLYQPTHNHNHNHNHNDFENHHHHQDPSISLNILSSCPSQEFQGAPGGVPTLAMLNRSLSFSGYQDHHQDHIVRNEHDHDHDQGGGSRGGGGEDDLSDDGSQVVMVGPGGGEKKKRLNMEQVKALEKNFEQANKLEPEKKMQLAKALGLQPRQVAIWFQNRRARWKTKQLEKDYNVLKRQFDALKADNDSLLSHNNKLHAELISLRNKEPIEYGAINLNNVDTQNFWSNNGSEISSEMNLNNSRTPQTGSPLSSNPSTKLQFSPNSFIPTNITQLLQTTTSSKTELDPQLQDDTYCTMFGGGAGAGGGNGNAGIENQPPPFWGWPEHQQNLN